MFLTIYMNSLFNPMLYIIRNTKYKKELKLIKEEIIAKCCSEKRAGKGSSIKFKRASAVSAKSTTIKRDPLLTVADDKC